MMPSSPKLILKRTEPSELGDAFAKFYCDLIPKLYNTGCPKFLEDVKIALKNMRRLKYNVNERHEKEFYTDIQYDQTPVRCAYMYGYGILNTAVAYLEFSKYLTDKKTQLSRLFSSEKIKICCLAGGAAFESVAISKSIYDFFSKYSDETDLFTKIEITVIDIVADWETEGKALSRALNESTDLFTTKRIQFDYNFLKADLLSQFDETVEKTIAEAHVVTIIKLASSIEEKSTSVCVSYLQNMIQNVTGCMDEESCLFMLDVAGGRVFRHAMDVVSKQKNKYKLAVYLYKKYRLLPKTVQEMQACINFRNVAEANALFPTLLTTVSSCFWIKRK